MVCSLDYVRLVGKGFGSTCMSAHMSNTPDLIRADSQADWVRSPMKQTWNIHHTHETYSSTPPQLYFAVHLQSLSLTDFSWVWLLMTFVERTQCGCIGQPSMSDWMVQDCVVFLDVTLCFDMLRRMCRIRESYSCLCRSGKPHIPFDLHVFHNLSS